LTSDYQQRHPSAVRMTSSRRKALLLAVRSLFGATLLVLVLTLSACHTLPQQPCERPVLPMPPALSEPLPSVSYSISAGLRIKSWANALTGTQTTLKP
jgi:hypothetical protein